VVGSEVGSFDDVLGCWEGTAPFGTCGVALGLMCATLAGVDVVLVDLVESECPEGLSLSVVGLLDSEWPEGFSLSLLDLFFTILVSGRDQCMGNLV
jgi:hypothetical protein